MNAYNPIRDWRVMTSLWLLTTILMIVHIIGNELGYWTFNHVSYYMALVALVLMSIVEGTSYIMEKA